MEVELPRDARYVGLLRDVAICVLTDLGAPRPAKDDITLAISEACANAVRHAVGTSAYSVRFLVGDQSCEIEVADLGPGLPEDTRLPKDTGIPEDTGLPEGTRLAQDVEPRDDALDAEFGRGLVLMRALVDELRFLPHDHGTRLRLRKGWPDLDLPARRSDRRP